MKNLSFSKVTKIILICSLGIFLGNCEGEDGMDGLNGANGIDGINGINGENGQNGVGFDELTQFGSITLNITGTRSDNVAFTHEAELKFVDNDARENSVSFFNPVEGSASIDFDVTRFVNSPNVFEENSVNLSLTVNDAGLETQSFDFQIDFDDYTIVSDDLKYFEMFRSYSTDIITNYSFNDTTNNLQFSFTMDIPGDSNETNNDITISGTVDVIVLERIRGIE